MTDPVLNRIVARNNDLTDEVLDDADREAFLDDPEDESEERDDER